MTASIRAEYPILRFITLFAILMAVFYLSTTTPFFQNDLLPIYLQLIAKLAAIALNVLGQNVTVVDTMILSSQFSINVVRGCDAIEPTVLFITAVLAFSTPILLKIPALIIGTVFLFFINLIRIISLFFVGIYYPKILDIMHIEVWSTLFILLAMLFFVLWLLWVIQHQGFQTHVSG